ncbi:MAG TPA: ribosome biogenesis factor YjgA [Kofleriaceae bacterium]|nr:ribosome biogenesis factor YjgA [Kofleriaceae bacterium]
MNSDDENPRVLAKRQKRAAGDRSATLARTLMQLPDSTIEKLELGEDLQHEVDQARRITSQIARRRAERALAGALRAEDLVELQKKLDTVLETGSAQPRLLHLAEQWRARLIEEGLAAAAEFPGGAADPLPQLIQNARRERDTGKPPGAKRALFRHVMKVLEKG